MSPKYVRLLSRPHVTVEPLLNYLLSGYIRGCAALVVIGLLFDFFGTLLTGLGLRSTDPNKKYKYYRVAIYALVVACKLQQFDDTCLFEKVESGGEVQN